MIGVTALQGPAKRIELVSEPTRGLPYPLSRRLSDALGMTTIVEHVRDSCRRDVRFTGDVSQGYRTL